MRDVPRVSIIGAGQCGPETATLACELGERLARLGCDVVCGGLGGVMQAACQGAKAAGGATLGILPGQDRREANPYVDTAVATGLGPMRNYLVVLNGDVTVAIEGGAGTLSEVGLAMKTGRAVIGLGQWSDVPGVTPASDVDHAVALVQRHLGL